MAKPSGPEGPLVTAVEKFDAALSRYAKTTRELLHLSLDNRKDLQRAEEVLTRFTDCDGELAQGMQAFQQAVAAVGSAQQADAEKVQARAMEVAQRRAALTALDQRLVLAVEAIKKINELLESIRGTGGLGAPDVVDQLGALIEQIKKVQEDAQSQGFSDVAKDAHTLSQQLESVQRQARELNKKIPRA